MSNLTVETLRGLPTNTLENEEARVIEQIKELQAKRVQIMAVLAERVIDASTTIG